MRILLYVLIATLFFFMIYGLAYVINKIEYNSIKPEDKKHNDSSDSDNTFTYSSTTVLNGNIDSNKKKYKKI